MIHGFRRRSALAAGLASLALVLAACSATPEPAPGPTTGGTTPTDEAPAGGDLVIGVTTDADSLYPWKAVSFASIAVLQTLYGTLTEYDQNLDVVPGLAESWEVSEDGLTVTFHLRDGVTFADGSSLDSEDVVFSLESIQDEATAASARSSLASVVGIEAPDASTVVLTLSAPDAALLANLAVYNMAILSSEDTEEELNAAPNGTGPFVFDSRTPSQSLTVARNDAYWGDLAILDTVEFRVIPDETSIVAALQANSIQFAVLNDPLVAQSAEAAGLNVQKTSQLNYHALMLNARRGVLGDVNVRLAIQCAIDRQEVLDTAALGEGEVTGPITSPAYKSDPSARPCPEGDAAKAEEYLAAAGHADGVTVKAMVSQGQWGTSVNEAQSIQAQLAEVGITLDLEVLEPGAFVERWLAGDFEAAVALNGARPDPDGSYVRYFTSTGNLNTVAGYASDRLDALFAEGRASSDPEVRRPVYEQIGRELEDNAVWVWLFTAYNYTVSTEGVSGFVPMANNSVQYLRTTSLS